MLIVTELLYLAPEHLRTYLAHKKYEVSQAADIYALGLIMHEILYRMEPFSERDDSVEGKGLFIFSSLSPIGDGIKLFRVMKKQVSYFSNHNTRAAIARNKDNVIRLTFRYYA